MELAVNRLPVSGSAALGAAGIAAAWSISYWTLLIPGFWYAGRPIGFGVSALIAAIWRYAAAALVAGLATAATIRGTPFWETPSGASAALGAIIIISMLFVTLYLGTVILFHWGLAPLRQLASLLRELAPSRKDTSRPPKPWEHTNERTGNHRRTSGMPATSPRRGKATSSAYSIDSCRKSCRGRGCSPARAIAGASIEAQSASRSVRRTAHDIQVAVLRRNRSHMRGPRSVQGAARALVGIRCLRSGIASCAGSYIAIRHIGTDRRPCLSRRPPRGLGA